MKFKELLLDTSWEEIKKSLIQIYDTSDINLEGYMNVISQLCNMEPTDNNMRICVEFVAPDGDLVEEGFWDIHGRNGTLHKDTDDAKLFPKSSEEWLNSEVTWGLEFTKWNEILGMEIDKKTANNFDLMKSDIVAHILWEITFIGFDESSIQEVANDLNEQCKKIKDMSEEEFKKEFYTFDEFKEKLKEIEDDEEKEE